MSSTNLDPKAHRDALCITLSRGVCVRGADKDFFPVLANDSTVLEDFVGNFVSGQYRGNASLGTYHAALLHPDAVDSSDFRLLMTTIGSFQVHGCESRLWQADALADGDGVSSVHPEKLECPCAGGWCPRSDCRAKAVIYRRIVPRQKYKEHKKKHVQSKSKRAKRQTTPACPLWERCTEITEAWRKHQAFELEDEVLGAMEAGGYLVPISDCESMYTVVVMLGDHVGSIGQMLNVSANAPTAPCVYESFHETFARIADSQLVQSEVILASAVSAANVTGSMALGRLRDLMEEMVACAGDLRYADMDGLAASLEEFLGIREARTDAMYHVSRSSERTKGWMRSLRSQRDMGDVADLKRQLEDLAARGYSVQFQAADVEDMSIGDVEELLRARPYVKQVAPRREGETMTDDQSFAKAKRTALQNAVKDARKRTAELRRADPGAKECRVQVVHSPLHFFWMSEDQKQLLRRYPCVLFLDATHGTQTLGYELVSLLVLLPDQRGVPVAHAYLQEASGEQYAAFLQFVDKALGVGGHGGDPFVPDVVVTDLDRKEARAVRAVWGGRVELHQCVFHSVQAIRRKMKGKENSGADLCVLLGRSETKESYRARVKSALSVLTLGRDKGVLAGLGQSQKTTLERVFKDVENAGEVDTEWAGVLDRVITSAVSIRREVVKHIIASHDTASFWCRGFWTKYRKISTNNHIESWHSRTKKRGLGSGRMRIGKAIAMIATQDEDELSDAKARERKDLCRSAKMLFGGKHEPPKELTDAIYAFASDIGSPVGTVFQQRGAIYGETRAVRTRWLHPVVILCLLMCVPSFHTGLLVDAIAASKAGYEWVSRAGGDFVVHRKGKGRNKKYVVDLRDGHAMCSCFEHSKLGYMCKHVIVVLEGLVRAENNNHFPSATGRVSRSDADKWSVPDHTIQLYTTTLQFLREQIPDGYFSGINVYQLRNASQSTPPRPFHPHPTPTSPTKSNRGARRTHSGAISETELEPTGAETTSCASSPISDLPDGVLWDEVAKLTQNGSEIRRITLAVGGGKEVFREDLETTCRHLRALNAELQAAKFGGRKRIVSPEGTWRTRRRTTAPANRRGKAGPGSAIKHRPRKRSHDDDRALDPASDESGRRGTAPRKMTTAERQRKSRKSRSTSTRRRMFETQ